MLTDPRSAPAVSIDVGAPEAAACDVEHVETSVSLPPTVEASDRLADHTTFHIGGPARRLVVATTEAQLVDAVRNADAAGEPVLILSGGSNVLVSDDGFDGLVVKVATRGVSADVSDCAGAYVTVEAGEVWDDLVAHAIGQGWMGIEALSGIPGLVGSTAIQNVGAYGADVSQTIARVRTWDRQAGAHRTFTASECGFGYRQSIFKAQPGRYLVLQVAFQLDLGSLSAPVRYAELAKQLGCELGDRVDAERVREAVIAIRRAKGMVVDEADHDTWSSGSFFMNPVLDADSASALPEGAPRFPQPDGTVKTSAAWLIDHAGFSRGHGSGRATLSTRHTLALTNRGGATASEVMALAREVRDGVRDRFGITLVAEPVLVGLAL